MQIAKRIKNITASKTLAVNQLARKMIQNGEDVINLSTAESDFNPPHHVKNAAIKAVRDNYCRYTDVLGDLELRETVSMKLKRDNKLTYSPDEIAVSCGAKHSLFNIWQAILNKGDEVIVLVPYWVSYIAQIELAGGKVVLVPTDNQWGIDHAAIKKKINKKTRAILINSPNNPTGAVYDKPSLRKLARLVLEKNIYIVSDEVYEHFIYKGQHHSIAEISGKVKRQTLVVNGISKSHCVTGWRIGYVAGAREVIEAINKIQSHTTSNPSSIAQRAATAALRKRNDHLKAMTQEFRKRKDYFIRRLESINRMSFIPPPGAYYIFLDIRKIDRHSLAFSEKLLKKAKLAVIPGEGFGKPGYIRLTYGLPIAKLKEASARLEEFINHYR